MLRHRADSLHVTLPRAAYSYMPSSMLALDDILVESGSLQGCRRAQRVPISWVESKGKGESKSRAKGESKSKTDLTMVGDDGNSTRRRIAWTPLAIALLMLPLLMDPLVIK